MLQSDLHTPFIRSYTTKWSIDDCLSFLRRKNIYDLYEFNFECRDGQYYLTFSSLWPREAYRHYHPSSVYSISFEQQEDQTVFTVRFHHTEGFMSDTPFVLTEHMDQFFRRKLDAQKKWPGES